MLARLRHQAKAALTIALTAASFAALAVTAATTAVTATALLASPPAAAQTPAATLPAVAPDSGPAVLELGRDVRDRLNRVTRTPASAPQTSTIAYDKLGRPVVMTDPAQGKTIVEYSPSQTPLAVQDPRGLITHYAGDTLGQPGKLQSPDSASADLRYDSAGNLTQRTGANGVVTTYTYDALDRLTTARHVPPAGSLAASNTHPALITRSWIYDQTPATSAGFSTNGIGRLTSQTYPAGQTDYAWDPQGRLLARRQTLQPIAGNTAAQPSAITHTLRYAYNKAGKITSVTYPSGRVVGISYAQGLPSALKLTSTTPAGASTTTSIISQLSTTPDGQAQRWRWHLQTASGAATTKTHERSYDTQGRLTRLPLGELVRDIRYDAAGRISQYHHYAAATGARQAQADHSITYDSLDRIVSASIGSTAGTTTYNYQWDANGNRTSQSSQSGASTVTRQLTTSPKSNQLQTLSNPATTLSSSHYTQVPR